MSSVVKGWNKIWGLGRVAVFTILRTFEIPAAFVDGFQLPQFTQSFDLRLLSCIFILICLLIAIVTLRTRACSSGNPFGGSGVDLSGEIGGTSEVLNRIRLALSQNI